MGQVVGSCAGAFSATCLTTLMSPTAGDFSNAPQWIPDTVDSVLVLTPFALRMCGIESPALAWYVLTLVVLNLLIVGFPERLAKRYYGIRLALPMSVAAVTAALGTYYFVDLNQRIVEILALVGSATFGFALAACMSDVGLLANVSLRNRLASIQDERFIRLAIQLMLVSVSVLLIAFSIMEESDRWSFAALIGLIVLLSVVKSEHQRGSVVSAAITVYIVTATATGIVPVELAVSLAVLHNAFFLHKSQSDHDSLPSLPLLDDEVHSPLLSQEQATNVRFKFSTFNMLLLAFFARGDLFEADLFFLISLITSAWVLIAPLLLQNRQFPF